MRTLTTALLSAIHMAPVCAQVGFEKIYMAGGTGHLIELASGNVLTGYGYSNTCVSLMDPQGNVIHTKCWAVDDTIMGLGSLVRYSDNEYFFTSLYRKDTCSFDGSNVVPKYYPVIGRMDSLGNVLAAHYYRMDHPDCTNSFGNLEVLSDKSVLALGSGFPLRAMKVDSTGVPVWTKRFAHKGGFRFIRQLPGGDLLAGINSDTAGASVARMDPDGSILWCRSYVRPNGMLHDCIIEPDGSAIISGYTDSIQNTNFLDPLPPGYHPKLFLMKLNGSGDVQWCKGYDSAPNLWYAIRGSHIEKAQDGNYVVLANLGPVGVNTHYRPFLMKTDQNGDTLWTRSVGANGYTYRLSRLLACSDAGYMFSGIIDGDLPENHTGEPFIIKTDSIGHMPCVERVQPIVVSDLFPVDSSFTITSIDGATMYPAFVSDTIFDPIAVYDACEVANGLNPMQASRKFRVRPNPTAGRITVEFEDPLMAESYYSIYDGMGRLLYQRPLPTGATMEVIDLSRYSKGTYVIKLTDPKGVRFERVVLE